MRLTYAPAGAWSWIFVSNAPRIAQTAPVVVGEHGHVEYVEVPTAVTEAPSHAHRRGRRLMDHMKCSPATVERCQSLVRSSGRQAGGHPQVEVLIQGCGDLPPVGIQPGRHQGRP